MDGNTLNPIFGQLIRQDRVLVRILKQTALCGLVTGLISLPGVATPNPDVSSDPLTATQLPHIDFAGKALESADNPVSGDNNQPNLPESWLGTIQQDIQQREYHFSQNEAGEWQAPNRQHGLRLRLKEGTMHIYEREAGVSLLSFSTVGVSRSGVAKQISTQSVPVIKQVYVTENRLEQHFFGINEWFINREDGVEHGYTLTKKPAGSGELQITLDFGAQLQLQGDSVRLLTPQGKQLNYGKLKVWDADGTVQPSRFEIHDQQLSLVIDDQNARYPLTIDPLLTSSYDALLESNQIDAEFGHSVAGAGDVNGDGYADVIVGAFLYDNGESDEGAAFIYYGSASGISTTAAVTLESNQIDAAFGNSVAGAGDINGDGYADVIVGAYQYDNGESNEGAAFIYHGSASGISTNAATTLERNQIGAAFGYSVASAGDVNGDGYTDVIVGAYAYDNSETNEGAVFVYHGSASGILTAAATTLEYNQAFVYFGYSVAGAGDVNGDGYADIIVGTLYFSNGEANEGAAFVYHGSTSGISTAAATTLESNEAGTNFGRSVAGAGDVNGDGFADVIVGAANYDNGESNEGAAFVYHGGASGVSTTAAVTLESNQNSAYFGRSVAGAGDVNGDGYADIIIGAPSYDNGENNEGAAFVYHGGASGIRTSVVVTLEINQIDADFGESVAAAGDVNGDGYADVIGGAYSYDYGETNEGAAFIYYGGANSIATTPATSLESNQVSAVFGWSVAGAGDVNGDGYADVIIGAPSYDNGEIDEGAAFISYGSASSFPTATSRLESNQASANFGRSVAGAGDVNGDGYADVIVGAYTYDNGESDEGAAFIYHGSASGITTAPATTLENNRVGDTFGNSVAGAGDVNGDGYADVIVGNDGYNGPFALGGAAFVYHGSATGISTTAASLLTINQSYAYFGVSVAGAGDTNGDGYADVIVGADRYDNGESNEGAVFVYHGSATGVASTADIMLESNQIDTRLGASIAGAGDVNGDGYADVIVGAHKYSNVGENVGAAFIYHGSASGIATTAAITLEGNQANDKFGQSVAGAGDVNGDGFADVIVGAYEHDNGESNEGAAFVYHGSSNSIGASAAIMLESNLSPAKLGKSIAGAGDVNGDGYADIIVGAPHFYNGEGLEGGSFIYRGNEGDYGKDLQIYMRKHYSTDLLHPWSLTRDSDTRFKIHINMHSPRGKEKVRSQIEICPIGVPFGDPGCEFKPGAYKDAGTDLTRNVQISGDPGVYRWRTRLEYLPWTATTAGITKPLHPSHGPWFYYNASESDSLLRIQYPPEPPEVSLVNTSADTGDGVLDDGEVIGISINAFSITFDRDILPSTAENPSAYRIVGGGSITGVQTGLHCSAAADPGDIEIPVDTVNYDVASRTATIAVNGSNAIPGGVFRLLVCGLAGHPNSVLSTFSVELDGDGDGTGGDDFWQLFTVLDNDGDGIPDDEDPDDDNDGMPDEWENANGLDPFVDDASSDDDGDTINNLDEYLGNTNPQSQDTDADSVNDNVDNCPSDANTDQADGDGDDIGDVCDTQDDTICFPIKASNGKVAVICL